MQKIIALGKKILICPLNWGLGHATRCVPIIKALQKQGHRVIIAADKGPLAFLQRAFPDLKFIEFPGFDPKYSKSNSQVLKMLASFPGALKDFRRDHKTIETIVKNRNIDIVISDNRFGCWSKHVHSVFITHQLHIRTPKIWRWASPIINFFNNSYIKKYDEVWVPDDENAPALGGRLSHPAIKRFKISYLGILSRFNADNQYDTEKPNKYLVILSGPEPQRTMFEDIVLKQAKEILSLDYARQKTTFNFNIKSEDIFEPQKSKNIGLYLGKIESKTDVDFVLNTEQNLFLGEFIFIF